MPDPVDTIQRWPSEMSAFFLDSMQRSLTDWRIGVGTNGESGGRSAELRCAGENQVWIPATFSVKGGEATVSAVLPAGALEGRVIGEVCAAAVIRGTSRVVHVQRVTCHAPCGGDPWPIRLRLVP